MIDEGFGEMKGVSDLNLFMTHSSSLAAYQSTITVSPKGRVPNAR
jgi:hypothetical protein